MLTEGKAFHSKIREARIQYGLTQKQVSDLTGVPLRSIENWEAGVRKCPNYVEKMVVGILDQKFGKPDHQTFFEELLEQLQSDLKYSTSAETKIYIQNLINDITEHLNK